MPFHGAQTDLCILLSWQDDEHGREFIQWFDPAVQSPPPERGYGQDCSFTFENLYNGLDLFAFAHFVGWFGKAVILRDFWACTILSVMFEVCPSRDFLEVLLARLSVLTEYLIYVYRLLSSH